MIPNLKYEKKLWKTFDWVIGVDEVGRGALAGPIMAVAVAINSNLKNQNAKLWKNNLIRDSKTLSELQREKIYKKFTQNGSCAFALASASNKTIDKIGIGKANKLVMRKAVEKLLLLLPAKSILSYRIAVLIDGNQKIFPELIYPYFQFPIIKGDTKVVSIALASIVAKVTRDRLMKRLHKKFQLYNWFDNKGYGTRAHQLAILAFGSSPYHRTSFLA